MCGWDLGESKSHREMSRLGKKIERFSLSGAGGQGSVQREVTEVLGAFLSLQRTCILIPRAVGCH